MVVSASRRRVIANALICLVVTVCLLCFCPVMSFAAGQEPRNVDANSTSFEIWDSTESESESAQGPENSWRYRDGQLISAYSDVPETYSLDSWSETEDGFVNDVGEVIEGAIRKGIDVSEHNGKVDWEKVKNDGISFAIIRCGYGQNELGQDDKWWEYNVSECERLGIPYGVYLYSYADSVEKAEGEAAHVLRLLKGHHPAYPVYYDLEESKLASSSNKELLASMATSFCEKIQKEGYTPGVYANTNWWNNYLTDSCFSSWDRWVAQYNHTCEYKGSYSLWQSTSHGQVDGIKGNVDINIEMQLPYQPVSANSVFDAPLQSGNYYVAGEKSNLVFDVFRESVSEGSIVQLYKLHGSASQQFYFESDDSGLYTIRNMNSGLNLGVEFLHGRSTGRIIQCKPSSSFDQRWIIVQSDSEGQYRFVSAANPSYSICAEEAKSESPLTLDRSDFGTVLLCSPSEVEPSSKPQRALPDGDYCIALSSAPSHVLDVYGGSKANGANVQLYGANGGRNQVFRLEYDGSTGYYTIANAASGKLLDVEGGSMRNCSNVSQFEDNGGLNQRWVVVPLGSGEYRIESAANRDFSLDVYGGSAKDGANVEIYRSNGSAAQRFSFLDPDDLAQDVPQRALPDGDYCIALSSAPSHVLDVYGGSKANGANVQLYGANGGRNQVFRLEYDGSTGYYTIANAASGKLLDVEGGSMRNCSNVSQFEDNGGLNQRWVVVPLGSGEYRIESAANRDFSLDVYGGSAKDGANVEIYRSNGSAAQRFSFLDPDDLAQDVPQRALPDGDYCIALSSAPSHVLDVYGGSKANGANVQLYGANGGRNQVFRLEYDGSTGYYTIANAASGKLLDVEGGSMRNCSNVSQFEDNGGLNQRWVVVPLGSGEYRIESAANRDFSLDVYGGSAKDGANVEIYRSNGSAAQRFSFAPVS